MSANFAIDIHALIAAGRVVEAGTLLAMHGEDLPSDMRQELEQERQRLWQRASDLIAEGEALEQAGWTEEAWSTYEKAAKIACDFPGIQETLKRLDEAVTLTKAVQHRSKRIRQNATRVVRTPNTSRRRSPWLLAAVVLLGLGAGLWLMKAPQKHLPPPAPTAPLTAPVPSETGPSPQPPVAVTVPAGETAAPQPPPSDTPPVPASTATAPPHAPTQPPAATAMAVADKPAPQPPPASPAPPASLLYTVQAGDTLALIAGRQLCQSENWSAIYKKNRKAVTHPDKLIIGTQLDLTGLPNRCPQPQ